MTANDCYRPSVDAQLRYTVQWFHEWSEMQRGDFLPILTQKLAPGTYVNGLISGMDGLGCGEGRPPSLFQCRVKLFREWVDGWSQAERDQLLSNIKSADPGFYARLEEELNLGPSNGETTHDHVSPCDEPIKSASSVPVAAPEDQEADDESAVTQQSVPDVAPVINSDFVGNDDQLDSEPEISESHSVEPDIQDDIEAVEQSE